MDRSDKAVILNAFPGKEEKAHLQQQFLLTAHLKAKIGISKKTNTGEQGRNSQITFWRKECFLVKNINKKTTFLRRNMGTKSGEKGFNKFEGGKPALRNARRTQAGGK